MLTRVVMTWPVTLARLPRAGAFSKPQGYKKINKTEGLSENMDYNGEKVWNFQSKQI